MTEIPPVLTPEVLVPRLGDYLVERNLISMDDLHKALEHQQQLKTQGRQVLLGQVLVELNLIDRVRLDQAITEQILQLRAALQEANAVLEKRVQERTAELENALKKLSELNQLKSNIIANISHELRTPLTHIKGYLELISSGAMGPLTEQQGNALQVVQKSTQRLERQIEDLIHFSLSAKGEFTLRLTPVAVIPLLKTMVARMADKAAERRIHMYIDCDKNAPIVNGDEEKLSWALLQLLDNAIKFTQPDGQVTISACQENRLVTIRVEDTGIGIPDNRIAEIFEPFHQLDASSTRRYGGTGLGLALVKQIIEAHGSVIRVRSKVGQGTSFEFVMPCIEVPTT